MRLETDYLVVGAGAVGMAFADALVAGSDADVVLVDRRDAPGGHWHDAYPFVRLHVPSAYYGVNSTVLGSDAVDRHGRNAGMYELAGAAEICAYYSRVLHDVLLPTGRVRFLGMHEYLPADDGHRVVARLTGDVRDVVVRRALVDATYLEGQVPATHTPSFAVAPGVRLVPINGLVDVDGPIDDVVVMGAGKTAIDACLWLLDHDVDPDRIRWVRPRDMWLFDRAGWQPLDQVSTVMEGLSLELEALAQASTVDDLFRLLEQAGRLLRIDQDVVPTMFRCATVSAAELEQLRRIRNVVRRGRVQRIDPERVVLDDGEIAAGPTTLHVDCTAAGIRRRPARPVFEPGRVTIQAVRMCTPTFNAALIGYVEATRDDDAVKNLLCPPNPYPELAADWMSCFETTMLAARRWGAEPDLSAWLEGARVNLLRGVLAHAEEPRMLAAFERFGANVKPGMAAVRRLLEEQSAVPEQREAREEASASS